MQNKTCSAGHADVTNHDLIIHVRVSVMRDKPFRPAPRVLSSAGVSAGIDFCLHLIARSWQWLR